MTQGALRPGELEAIVLKVLERIKKMVSVYRELRVRVSNGDRSQQAVSFLAEVHCDAVSAIHYLSKEGLMYAKLDGKPVFTPIIGPLHRNIDDVEKLLLECPMDSFNQKAKNAFIIASMMGLEGQISALKERVMAMTLDPMNLDMRLKTRDMENRVKTAKKVIEVFGDGNPLLQEGLDMINPALEEAAAAFKG